MCMITAQDRLPAEETKVTSNLLDLKLKKKFVFAIRHLFLPPKLHQINKSRDVRLSLLSILESSNEYVGVPELIASLPTVKFNI